MSKKIILNFDNIPKKTNYKSIADFCRNSIDIIGYQLHPVQIRELIKSKQERDGFRFELVTDFKLKREVLCRDDCF